MVVVITAPKRRMGSNALKTEDNARNNFARKTRNNSADPNNAIKLCCPPEHPRKEELDTTDMLGASNVD